MLFRYVYVLLSSLIYIQLTYKHAATSRDKHSVAAGQLASWKPADLDRIMDTSLFNIERDIAITITIKVHTPYCSVVYHLSVRPSVWTDGQTSSALWGYAMNLYSRV